MNEDYSDQIAIIFKKKAFCIDFQNGNIIRPQKKDSTEGGLIYADMET